MSETSDNLDTVQETAIRLDSLHLDHSPSENGSDSSGSIPDLVAADGDTDVSDTVEQIRPTTPIVHTDTRAVNNASNNHLNNAGPPAYQPPFFGQHPNTGYQGFANGIIQGDGSSSLNWRGHGPARLAYRAVRDAVFERYVPTGNEFRRGGGPYHIQGGRARAFNPEMLYNLLGRVQRIENMLQDIANHQHWVVHRC